MTRWWGQHTILKSDIIISQNQMIGKRESRQIIALVFVYGAQMKCRFGEDVATNSGANCRFLENMIYKRII